MKERNQTFVVLVAAGARTTTNWADQVNAIGQRSNRKIRSQVLAVPFSLAVARRQFAHPLRARTLQPPQRGRIEGRVVARNAPTWTCAHRLGKKKAGETHALTARNPHRPMRRP